MGRQIILLGAPTSGSLNWDDSDLAEEHKTCQVRYSSPAEVTPLSPAYRAEWRQLRWPSQVLEPSFMQPTADHQNLYPATAATDFFRTADLPSGFSLQRSTSDQSSSIPATVESSDDLLSDFYDHSFTVNAEITSSQLDALTKREEESVLKIQSSPNISAKKGLPPCHLSDLEDIPNAAYLRSIAPQTMTVNLIVAIMSLPSPRVVTTGRRWGREKQSELVEILVGDETKNGFGITLWLTESSDMRKQLKHLRLGDIVLFRNVALGSFRDQVHGQSLRRGITKVDLLYGRTMDAGNGERRAFHAARDANNDMERNTSDPQLVKIRRVKDWMDTFVYDQSDAGGMDGRRAMTRPILPPDTQ